MFENAKMFKTREELLTLVPGDAIFLEIGVFKGDFSKQVIKTTNPKEFYMVDIWQGGWGSGDQNGDNHLHIDDMERVYLDLYQQTKHKNNIHVIRSTSIAFLQSCEDNYFDVIYVDGDHAEHAVYNDLVHSYNKIKNNGLLMGHDFDYTLGGHRHRAGGDVVRAVIRFCQEYKQTISCIADDGCPSFVINIQK
jgi:hypothetical protein